MKINRTRVIFCTSLALFPLLGVLFLMLHMENAYITFFTFSYHIWERMIMGTLTTFLPIKGTSWVFRTRKWEKSFYEAIGIRKWKDKLPTYTPEAFEVRNLETLRKAMLRSERGHILGFFLAYLPIFVALHLGYLTSIFVITSLISSLLDIPFVIVQRYNSERVSAILARK